MFGSRVPAKRRKISESNVVVERKEEIWNDESHPELARLFKYIQNKPVLEELLLTYMNIPIATTVCQKWESFVEKNADKMKPYKVDNIWIRCGNTSTVRLQNEGRVNILEHGIDEQVLPDFFLSKIFKNIRFFIPEKLDLTFHSEAEAQSFIETFPFWWKSAVEKTALSVMYTKTTSHLMFMCSFPDLHLLKIEDKSFEKPVSCIQAMTSMQSIILDGPEMLLNSEVILKEICVKSNLMNKIPLPQAWFSSKALINFLQNGNFDTTVHFEFGELYGGLIDKDPFMEFVATTQDYQIDAQCKIAEFSYRNTRFELIIGMQMD